MVSCWRLDAFGTLGLICWSLLIWSHFNHVYSFFGHFWSLKSSQADQKKDVGAADTEEKRIYVSESLKFRRERGKWRLNTASEHPSAWQQLHWDSDVKLLIQDHQTRRTRKQNFSRTNIQTCDQQAASSSSKMILIQCDGEVKLSDKQKVWSSDMKAVMLDSESLSVRLWCGLRCWWSSRTLHLFEAL